MPPLPPEHLTYPVLITLPHGGHGSGFFLNTEEATYLVTACHVLFKNRLELHPGTIGLSSLTSDLINKAHYELDGTRLLEDGALVKHPTADVAVCKLENRMRRRGQSVVQAVRGVSLAPLPDGVFVSGLEPEAAAHGIDDVTISNEVFLFGYPTSLGRTAQIDGSRPLLRKGIVAGKTEDNRIVIDCPVYFGNSGGLVVEMTTIDEEPAFMGIGIATEMVPFVEELWSKQFNAQTGVRYENSGYAIVEPMDRILELVLTR